jgi:hypothetical protein
MPNIPIEQQILPADHLSHVQMSIQVGKPVCGDDLLLAIEQISGQPLSEVARNLVRRALIPAAKSPGRPSKFGAPLDFALEKLDQRYPALLRYEKRKKDRLLKRGKATLKGESPSMLAYARLLRHMKVDFGPMSWEALKNLHSAWRRGHFHSAENEVESEDYDAEIDRLFPAAES